jgi:L-alanine-DL-glutamate epimerase-like enolase superfamily enzyme
LRPARAIHQDIFDIAAALVAVTLLAAKFGVPICPHAGGVGLCEYAQHVSMFDYVAVGATFEDRVSEFVDHLHEHFVDPVVVRARLAHAKHDKG